MYQHAARSGDLADIHRVQRAKETQHKKEKAPQAKSEGVSVSHPSDASEKQAEHIGRKVASGEEVKGSVQQQKGIVQRKVQRQPQTKKQTSTLKFTPASPYYLPEDETYQHKYDYSDKTLTPYKNSAEGSIVTSKDRVQSEDAYVLDLQHDNIPAQKWGSAFVYRKEIHVRLKDGRTLYLKLDGVNMREQGAASLDSKGITRFNYQIEVYDGSGNSIKKKGSMHGVNVSINDFINIVSTNEKIPLDLVQNSTLDQYYLLTAKQYVDGLLQPASQTNTSQQPVAWDKMTRDQKKSKALKDIFSKVSYKSILLNAVIAIIGVIVLAIIAAVFGWEIALIVGLIVLIGGFLYEFFNAQDDEERLNIIVRYISYVILAIAAIIFAPAILAATGSLLITGVIIGCVAALVLSIIGFIFLLRRLNRAADAKTPEQYEHETDQGARVVETTVVDYIASIVSGFLPPIRQKLPPSWRDRWNPFMPKVSPALPPTFDDPFLHPQKRDPLPQSGQQGKGAGKATTSNKPHLTSQNLNHLVDYNGQQVPVYRGGNSFKIRPSDIKINPSNNMVKTSHGISVDVNSNAVSKFGGAYEIKSLPDGLKIIQRGKTNPGHFEIVPEKEMPQAQFQALLNQIKTELKK